MALLQFCACYGLILCYSTINYATDITQLNKHLYKVHLFMKLQLPQCTA